jgi:type I restriction enzyme R subunit
VPNLPLSRRLPEGAASERVGYGDEARDIRHAVGFSQTVRAALSKTTAGKAAKGAERDFAMPQIVSRAVVSTEIVDILQAPGVPTPDISILSDGFLAGDAGMRHRNPLMEALRKLLNGEIRSRSKVNLVQTETFTERLEEAIARYHSNAITTAEVIQELIRLAKEIREARRCGEEAGLSEDEIAFSTTP